MTLAIAVVIAASLATVAAAWPRVRGALRGRAVSVVSGHAFVAFALWTIYGELTDSPALVAVCAIGLVATSLALSIRALLGDVLRSRGRGAASRA